MPRYIAKFADLYCEWSTIVDAPVTNLMPLDEFKSYYVQLYGSYSGVELADRLRRVEETGCSSMIGETAESLLSCNRAGPNETSIGLRALIKRYGPKRTKKGGPS